MKSVKQSRRKFLLICLAIAIPIIPCGIALVGCDNTTETVQTITNINGEDFEIADNSSAGFLVTNYWVSVYASPTTVGNKSLFSRWNRHRTEIFRYDWSYPNGPYPSIKASGPDKILVSIPSVSSVMLKRTSVENVHIDYAIGHIDYP